MTFSGNGLPDGFEDLVEQIVRRTGYRLAGEKTKGAWADTNARR